MSEVSSGASASCHMKLRVPCTLPWACILRIGCHVNPAWCQVRDLARLSLRDPEYLAVHAEAGAPTPAKLQQAVMEVPLPQKLDALWSFVKAHLRVGAVTTATLRLDITLKKHDMR